MVCRRRHLLRSYYVNFLGLFPEFPAVLSEQDRQTSQMAAGDVCGGTATRGYTNKEKGSGVANSGNRGRKKVSVDAKREPPLKKTA